MTACPDFDHLLVLPHRRVQNANAVSSPLTHGFPSMTAFLGLAWALQRKARAAGLDLAFPAIGVVCHDRQEQTTDSGFVRSFRLTRNPVGKDGAAAAIVEEGRIHLDLSLVLAVRSQRWASDTDARHADLAQVADWLDGLRIAGGSVLPSAQPTRSRHRPFLVDLSGTAEDRAAEFRKLRMRLLPGSALVAREDLLDRRWAELQATEPQARRLDAWLSLARVNWRYRAEDGPQRAGWAHDRAGGGWIVPIPVGYGALGELLPAGSVANARDGATPFRFVESLYSVGEWVGAHRLPSPQHLLWYADSQPDLGLYRCRNDYRPPASDAEADYDFD